MTAVVETDTDESQDTRDYTNLINRRVTVTRNTTDADGKPVAVEVKGLFENINEFAVLIKPTGRSAVELIELSEVEDIVAEIETPKKITVKYLKVVELGQARNHLLERHGVTLSEINSLSEDDAFKLHAGLDHKATDLGHMHGNKPVEQAALATPSE